MSFDEWKEWMLFILSVCEEDFASKEAQEKVNESYA